MELNVLEVDADHLGTPESSWRSSGVLEALAPLDPDLERPERVVVVAPHPDDEVLGAGGLIERALALGLSVEIVAVTDGEASHPLSPGAARLDLRTARAAEAGVALRRLGCEAPIVTRLAIPDGRVSEYGDHLCQVLAELLTPGDLCVAPWQLDGHPDHDACGAAAMRVAEEVGACLLGYLVWTWHWARPDDDSVPWSRCRRLELSRREAARKRWASGAFTSQIRPLGKDPADAAVLPDAVLRRSWRSCEVFVDGRAAG